MEAYNAQLEDLIIDTQQNKILQNEINDKMKQLAETNSDQ
jgi:hypothetical protein